jgi:hypothetical protein
MIILGNNDEKAIGNGAWSYKTTGSLDLQWSINGEAFTTISTMSLTGVKDGIIDIGGCRLKAINASTNTITLTQIS